MTPLAASLKKCALFAGLDEGVLEEVATRASKRRYSPGERIVSELEPGADVYVMTSGTADVSVEPGTGPRRVLGTLGAGGVVGEMASVTGDLRSATVTATNDVEALVIADEDFDRLRERRPEVAVHVVQLLAERLAAAERAAEVLLDRSAGQIEPEALPPARRGSIRRIWLELVVNRQRDLAFLTLAAFVLTLIMIRGVVFASFHFDVAPRGILRVAYLAGFALLISSSLTSLLTFRTNFRRAIAVAYGVGLALILNELGVTLAFDIFFKDIHTADPNVPFDIERLYRRTEPLRAIAIGLVVLLQAVYLRRFYRRSAFVVTTRMRKLLARR